MIEKWQNIKELIEYPSAGILSKELVKTDRVDITLFCMAKGTVISEHTSTRKGIVYAVEGKGIFNLEGEEITLAPEVFIFMRENAVHSLKAEENLTFILYLF